MKTIREWAFPVGLLLAWMLASVYTVNTLFDAHTAHQQFQRGARAYSPGT
jgi:hypothetical protein